MCLFMIARQDFHRATDYKPAFRCVNFFFFNIVFWTFVIDFKSLAFGKSSWNNLDFPPTSKTSPSPIFTLLFQPARCNMCKLKIMHFCYWFQIFSWLHSVRAAGTTPCRTCSTPRTAHSLIWPWRTWRPSTPTLASPLRSWWWVPVWQRQMGFSWRRRLPLMMNIHLPSLLWVCFEISICFVSKCLAYKGTRHSW